MSVELSLNLYRLLFLFALIKSAFSSFYPCGDKYGITQAEASAVMDDWPRNLKVASVNRTHKCYVSCIFWYFGIIDSEGNVDLNKYYDMGVIDEYVVAPIINRCSYQYKDEIDLCERTFSLFHCLRLEKLATK